MCKTRESVTTHTVTGESDATIKVAVHIPEKVSAAIRQRKINTIYDIFSKAENKG